MRRVSSIAVLALLATMSLPAQAIPAFARKYATSCQTCHTIYPKLTPFGEAFRRNGFRFPGTDSDYWKQESVTLTPKTGSGDATVLSVIPPLSFGGNGFAVVHPDKNASGALADNGAIFSLRDAVEEAHLWTGGSLSDTTTYFGEVTFGGDGTVDLEHLQLHFNDLLGPQHAFNLRIGRGFNTISTFGPHSSYLSDTRGVSLAVAGLQGGTPSWNALDHYNGLEATGVLGGRLDYAVGINAGATGSVLRNSENFYGHLGFKLGGMRLDGEGKSDTNPARPWEETAFTVEAFGYHAFGAVDFAGTDAGGAPTTLVVDNTTNGAGGGIRLQLGSLELNSGIYYEHHSRATPDFAAGAATSATAFAHYDELSYMVTSWLVPAVRFEYFSLSPEGAATQSLYRILPGFAMTATPNAKLFVVAVIEGATGEPPGGWGQVGGSVAPADAISKLGPELEAITFNVAIAF
jgi:hypothetical protein